MTSPSATKAGDKADFAKVVDFRRALARREPDLWSEYDAVQAAYAQCGWPILRRRAAHLFDRWHRVYERLETGGGAQVVNAR